MIRTVEPDYNEFTRGNKVRDEIWRQMGVSYSITRAVENIAWYDHANRKDETR